MNEQSENLEQMKLLQLLKELTEVQMVLAKVNTQLVIRSGKEQIEHFASTTTSNLKKHANNFGIKLSKYRENYLNEKDIISEYSDALAEINSSYDTLFQEVLEQQTQLELEEQDNIFKQNKYRKESNGIKAEISRQQEIIKAKIIQATRSGDLLLAEQELANLKSLSKISVPEQLEDKITKLQAERTKLRELIESCQNQYDAYLAEKEATIAELTEGKNNKLATIPKQNIIQKLAGSLFNKFNGAKKFTRTAIQPLKDNLKSIKENELPVIKQSIHEKMTQFSNKMQNARNEVFDVVTNMEHGAKDAVSKGSKAVKNFSDERAADFTFVIKSGKRLYRTIIEKGHQSKLDFINKATLTLTEKQTRANEKLQLLSNDKDNNTGRG